MMKVEHGILSKLLQQLNRVRVLVLRLFHKSGPLIPAGSTYAPVPPEFD